MKSTEPLVLVAIMLVVAFFLLAGILGLVLLLARASASAAADRVQGFFASIGFTRTSAAYGLLIRRITTQTPTGWGELAVGDGKVGVNVYGVPPESLTPALVHWWIAQIWALLPVLEHHQRR